MHDSRAGELINSFQIFFRCVSEGPKIYTAYKPEGSAAHLGFAPALTKGFSSAAYRSTDATVFVPIEGGGRSIIGEDFMVDWEKRDIFVILS